MFKSYRDQKLLKESFDTDKSNENSSDEILNFIDSQYNRVDKNKKTIIHEPRLVIPKTMIDFFVEDPASVQNSDGIQASPVLQVLQSVSSPENMILE